MPSTPVGTKPGPADEKRDAAPSARPARLAERPGRQPETEQEPDHATGKRKHVRQPQRLEIGAEKSDEERREHQPRRRAAAGRPMRQSLQHERDRRPDLDQRVSPADRRPAGPASAAEHQVTHTGMLSNQRIGVPQIGSASAASTTDSPAGSREMQTFRKLPTISPNTPSSTSSERRHWPDQRREAAATSGDVGDEAHAVRGGIVGERHTQRVDWNAGQHARRRSDRSSSRDTAPSVGVERSTSACS